MNKAYKIYFILIFILSVSSGILKANEGADSTQNAERKAFDAGKMILEHIGDAYEWHITSVGNMHISIPLPVILYSNQSGFHAFMSGRFHHGEEEYNGFMIAKDGRYAGKIVETSSYNEQIRPYDFSITKNVLSLFIAVILIITIFINIANRYSENFARAPQGLQSWIEPIIIFVRDDIAKANIGEKKYEKYLPYLLTIFFFILINNLLGLVPVFPGGTNLTGNIAVTMVMAIFTFVITSFSGTKEYWMHIINAPGVPWWLKFPIPLMPVVEIMSLLLKPFVLMIRLFANITAGHIIALGFFSLIFIFGEKSIFAGYGVSIVSIAFTLFMSLLELLVSFIQAYVFTLLSALYIGMAIEKHEHNDEVLNIAKD
jgi:F-type H+-transporting ATPase subunit a